MKQFLSSVFLAMVMRLIIRPIMDRTGITAYLQNWRTDWITGIALAIIIVFAPAVIVILFGG